MHPTFLLSPPRPDCRQFVEIVLGRSRSRRVPLIEYLIDDSIMRPVLVNTFGREWCDRASGRDAYLDNMIWFWHRMGYDVLRYEESLPFPHREHSVPDTAPGITGRRVWPDEHTGTITTWEQFERYPWPSVEEFDFTSFEYLNDHLPEGMGLVCSHAGGVYEHLSWIMSFEGLCYALHDDMPLVEAIVRRLGGLMSEFYSRLLDLDRLVAVFPGDDMGYKSATLISPALLRTLILPWHARFAGLAHACGIPYFMHSCGNVADVMEDLIEGVGIDAKHSFEDGVMPVERFYATYGERIGVLGGVDLHTLAGGTVDEVRSRVRFLLETCGSKGRYAVGSGNSIPSYVPVENYLGMVEETHIFNRSRA